MIVTVHHMPNRQLPAIGDEVFRLTEPNTTRNVIFRVNKVIAEVDDTHTIVQVEAEVSCL